MSTFADYYNLAEAKIRDIPEWAVTEATRIVQKYKIFAKDFTPKDLKDLKKIGTEPEWVDYYKDNKINVWFVAELTNVKIIDYKTNKPTKYRVVVAFGTKTTTTAMCDSDEKIITIFYYSAQDLSESKLISSIVHEIVHGYQQHKTYSKKYERLLKDKNKRAITNVLYHKEPIEFDAYTSEIAHTINQQYNKHKNDIKNSKFPETKKIMEKKLKKFILELKLFIKSPIETYFYYKELNLPTSFETFTDFITDIRTDRKLWMSFKNKLRALYDNIIKRENLTEEEL